MKNIPKHILTPKTIPFKDRAKTKTEQKTRNQNIDPGKS